MRPPRQNLRWLWITNPENLDLDQRQELGELKVLVPELGRLHDLREDLRWPGPSLG